MSETRAKALERMLSQLDEFDFFKPRHESEKEIISEAVSVFKPFLQNPERHERQVALIVEFALLSGITRVLNPLLKVYNFPLLRRYVEKRFTQIILEPLKQKIEGAREEVLSAVDPGELRLDLLPVVTVETIDDWKAQGRRLVVIETRGVVIPATGMQLQALSHHMEIESPIGCQFVDSVPSNEMEVVAHREITVSERGKFVHSKAEGSKVTTKIKGGVAEIGSAVEFTRGLEVEAESTAGEKLSHSSKVIRVISSAVGNTAMWQLMRTPSQTLLGTNKFSATLLVPADARSLKIKLRFGAEIEGWGPTSLQDTRKIEIPNEREGG